MGPSWLTWLSCTGCPPSSTRPPNCFWGSLPISWTVWLSTVPTYSSPEILTSTWRTPPAGLGLPRWRACWLPTALSSMCAVQLRGVATLWTSSRECLRPPHPVCGCATRDSRTTRRLHVACTFPSHAPAVRKQISVRNYKSVNMDSLRRDLATCRELHSLPGNVETAAQQYDSALGAILDQYSPKKTKTITVRPDAVWFDDHIHYARRIIRQLERRWRQSGLQVH